MVEHDATSKIPQSVKFIWIAINSNNQIYVFLIWPPYNDQLPLGSCVASKVFNVSGFWSLVDDDPAADISRYSTPVPVAVLALLLVEIPTEEAPVKLLQPSIIHGKRNVFVTSLCMMHPSDHS